MSNYIIHYSDDYLEHHGILGMKWGVRRFQNEDGSLTAAGQKRYNRNEAYRAKLEGKYAKSAEKNKNLASEARRNIKDIKENGTKSRAYQELMDDRYQERKEQYDIDHEGMTLHNIFFNYDNSFTKALYDEEDTKSRTKDLAELLESSCKDLDRYKSQQKHAEEVAARYANYQVNALQTKSQIRKASHY